MAMHASFVSLSAFILHKLGYCIIELLGCLNKEDMICTEVAIQNKAPL